MGILTCVKLRFKRSSDCSLVITTIWKCVYIHKGQIRPQIRIFVISGMIVGGLVHKKKTTNELNF